MSHFLETALELKLELSDVVHRLEHSAAVFWIDLCLLGSLYVARFIVWRHLHRIRKHAGSRKGGA